MRIVVLLLLLLVVVSCCDVAARKLPSDRRNGIRRMILWSLVRKPIVVN